MLASTPSSDAMRVADLSPSGTHAFEIVPTADELAEISAELELDALRKVRFAGRVVAQGKTDWRLDGTLGATIVQPCGVTLAPVTTRIDTPVVRTFVRDYADPDTPEAEMPEDETIESLGAWIDPRMIMVEALSLEIPQYPRADGAELGEVVHTAPGQRALRDSDLKPFAGLSALKAQLDDDSAE